MPETRRELRTVKSRSHSVSALEECPLGNLEACTDGQETKPTVPLR